MADEGVRPTGRRDRLREIEGQVREQWAEAKVFEADVDPSKESFLVTFPYPYMNGRLHLGHAFSMTKADFTVAYQRLKGKNALFPFAFHCTGMPIQGAANKLKNEMEQYGVPPVVPDDDGAASEPKEEEAAETQVGNFKAKKTKTARKTGTAKLQWDILKSMGIPESEIPCFADPIYWLKFFPRLGEQDLKLFGLHTDWRRSFITTDENKFYDKFIQWQFLRLRENGKIDFGRRATIFSPLDKQACADHDRASGEGVGPQEYTLIKLAVLELAVPELQDALSNGKLFMVAATLRPETMYGQTNCFVLPSGEYGAYEFDVLPTPGAETREKQVLICSERAARNMAYQDPFTAPDNWGNLNLLCTIKGKDLVGTPVRAPKTVYERVYTLPLLTISMTKGTGVVTSVPSDAPDDYAALRDWQTDEKLREKHGVTEEMVASFEVVPIVEIPGMGDKCAVYMCDKLKIKSQNDKKKLAEAKAETYKEGFYKGIMIAGEEDGVKGMAVSEAKDIVKAKMCEAGQSFTYYEPEKEVVSRTGDECVVAYLDQWFIDYGETSWANAVKEHVSDPARFETYTDATRKAFKEVLDWLKAWACSRNFGLGTRVPWDVQFVIESLSDSTIYMAFYTISHMLQGRKDADDYTGDGGKGSPLGVTPEQCTPEVFDYIFLKKPYPEGCEIPEETLAKLRESFEYWYPMNLRVSGRDLVQNHLTMSLYNHAAIWHDRPEMWPQGFFANGFVEVEGQKMSKSAGNFIMLNEAITGERTFELDGKKIVVGWSADATRLSLASAGDLLEDANFSCEIADKAILRLFTELEWAKEHLDLAAAGSLRDGEEMNFHDRAFDAQMDLAVQNTDDSYKAMRFRDVVKYGYYEWVGFRDAYRDALVREGLPLHAKLVRKFLELGAIILSPICPHYCEHVWRELLGKEGFVVAASWPETGKPDVAFVRSVDFLYSVARKVRVKVANEKKKRAKKGDNSEITTCTLVLRNDFPAYHQAVLRFLNERCVDGVFPADIMKQVKDWAKTDPLVKPEMKAALQKAAFAVGRVKEEGDITALELSVPYDQAGILEEQRAFLTSVMQLESFAITMAEESDDSSLPGDPGVSFP